MSGFYDEKNGYDDTGNSNDINKGRPFRSWRFIALLVFAFIAGLYGAKYLPITETEPHTPNALQPSTAKADSPGLDLSRCPDYERSVVEATRRAMPAVVSVHTYGERNIAIRDPFWQMFYGGNRFTQKISAMGSGVIIDSDGIVVTNDHVISLIKDSSGNYQGDIRISLVDGRKYDAEVVKSFPHQDVAILRVDGGGLPYIDFASSANVVQGQTAIAIGNPFGASLTEGLSGGEPTVTRGVVSATKRSLTIRDESGGTRYYRNMIQTDASINSGNSGGALVDINGDLIGINSTIFTAGGKGSIGIGFAIPSDRVQLILDHMQRYGDIGTPYFGIESVSTLTNEMMDALDLTAEGGVIINDIDNNSPADRAGLKAGDVILGVNGLYVTNAEEIISQFRGAIPGETFELLIFRRGEYRNIGLKIGMQE